MQYEIMINDMLLGVIDATLNNDAQRESIQQRAGIEEMDEYRYKIDAIYNDTTQPIKTRR